MTDGNDIPIREAFEWTASGEGKGMALWYKNTGPWWDSTSIKKNDGISFEEQQKDPQSLYNHYRKLIQLKKSTPALGFGEYKAVSQRQRAGVFFFTVHGSRNRSRCCESFILKNNERKFQVRQNSKSAIGLADKRNGFRFVINVLGG